MTKFFHFSQNNSGGFFHVDEVVDEGGCVFEASSPKEANKRAKKAGVFSRSFCDCCGRRFSEAFDFETGFDSAEEAVASHWSSSPVVVHFKDGTSKKMQKPA
jgi:hypothetical protein